MVKEKPVQRIEQIKQKLKTGDYNILAQLLNVDAPTTARMRFLRGDADAIDALQAIVDNREQLIKNYKANKG